MRSIERSIDYYPPVEVYYRSSISSKPLQKRSPSRFVMLGDGVVVNRIEIVPVHGNTLVGVCRVDASNRGATDLLLRAYRPVSHRTIK